jgi:hypothetical protein
MSKPLVVLLAAFTSGTAVTVAALLPLWASYPLFALVATLLLLLAARAFEGSLAPVRGVWLGVLSGTVVAALVAAWRIA